MPKHSKTIIFIILCIVGFGLSNSFAATPNICTTNDFWLKVDNFMNLFLSLLAWLWIPFATIAGKLMSNGMIYGEFINMDKILYMLRNISRTFANFLAAGLILYNIVIGLTSGEDQSGIVKKVLKIAGGIILANMSWFIVGAVIDLSTIVTTTVAALPGTYFNADVNSKNQILKAVGVNKLQRKMTFNTNADFCNGEKIIEQSDIDTNSNTNQTDEELLDMVMPKGNSIAGPLLYLRSSVIKIQDFIITNNVTSSGVDNVMIIFIRLAMTTLFVIAIIMLLVINIFRILYLRFFIAFCPLLILLYMGKEGETPIPGMDKFSMKNMIKIIFAPVIITALLSVAMIMIVLMQQVLQANNSYVKFSDGLLIENTKNYSMIGAEGVFQTDIKGSLIYDSIKNPLANTFSDLLMVGLTIAILRGIVKAIQAYNKDGIGSGAIDGIANLSASLLGSIPIVPIGGSRVGLGSLAKKARELPGDISSRMQRYSDSKTDAIENRLKDMSNKYLGTKMAYAMTPEEKRIVEKLNKQLYDGIQRNIDDVSPLFNIIKKNVDPRASLKSTDSSKLQSGIINIFKHIHQQYNGDLGKFMKDNGDFRGAQIKRQEGDENNFETFLNRNAKGNDLKARQFRDFLTYIYKESGGDGEYIKGVGESELADKFRNQRFRKKGEKIEE